MKGKSSRGERYERDERRVEEEEEEGYLSVGIELVVHSRAAYSYCRLTG